MITEFGEGKYYLYRHIRLDKDEVFYIGIGTKNNNCYYGRANSKHRRNRIWKNVTNKTDYKIEILLESNDYDFIKQKEIEFINLYGRKDLKTGTLCNLTDGGEGSRGWVAPQEFREKLSQRMLGHKVSQETIEKIRKKTIGQKRLPEFGEKVRARCKGNIMTEEQKAKISTTLKGKKHTEERKKKHKEAVLKFHKNRNKEQPRVSHLGRVKILCKKKTRVEFILFIDNTYYCCFNREHASYLLSISKPTLNKHLNLEEFVVKHKIIILKNRVYSEEFCLSEENSFYQLDNSYIIIPNKECAQKAYSLYQAEQTKNII